MIITLYDRVTDVATDKSSDISWESFAELLTSHSRREHKDGLGFSPASFRPSTAREDSAVVEVSALVFDIDKLTEADAGIVLDRLRASGLRFVWHTTHSHAPPDKASLRVALALSRAVPQADWRAFYHAAAKQLGLPYEVKCCNPSRFWYLPSCPDSATPEAEALDGIPLDVDSVSVGVPEHQTALRATDRKASPALLAHVMARLAEHGPAVQGQSGDAHTFTACAIARHGFALNEAEALTVLSLWDQSNDPPWGPDGLRIKIRNAQRYAKGAYGEAREVFESRGNFPGTDAPTGTFVSPGAALLADAPVASGELYAPGLVDFLGQDDPDDSSDAWIVHGVLAASVPQIIGGPPKSHKTFIAEHLMLSIAAGLPCWLEQPSLKITPTNVLMLLREDSFKESRRRIWRLARGLGLDPRDLKDSLWIDCVTPFYFHRDDDVMRLGRTIKDRGIGVVVIDSLSRTHQGDENSVKEMSIVTSRWNEICQSSGGVAVPIIHHFNKWGEGPLLQRLRGSSDIGAMVRHIVGVTKDEQGSALVEFDGNLFPILDPFNIKIADGVDKYGRKSITLTHSGDARQNQNEVMDRRILEALAQAGPMGYSAAALQKLQGNAAFKIARRDALLRQGKIMIHEGRYHLQSATAPQTQSPPIDRTSPGGRFLKE